MTGRRPKRVGPERIETCGAREHAPRDIDVDLPERAFHGGHRRLELRQVLRGPITSSAYATDTAARLARQRAHVLDESREVVP